MAKKNNKKGNVKTQNKKNTQNRKAESGSQQQYNKREHMRAAANDPKMYVNRVMGSTNDFSWYNKNPGLIQDATKISFFNQLGAKIKSFGNKDDNSVTVPGIMTFPTVTGPGTSLNSTSGASLAGLSCYDAIRRELNKPNPDYEAQDVMMYILACDDIFAQYINILRAFGIAHTWSADNLYTPKAYLKAIYGWSTSDFMEFITNEANYRAEINLLLTKAASFLFYPADFSITDRHSWLFGNIFMDHDSLKSQVYAFTKHNSWEFTEVMSAKGTALRYVPNKEQNSMSIMINEFDKCIEALRSSDLVRSLVADMRQSFGDSNLLQMGRIDEAYAITPTYDTNALMQIENLDVNFAWDGIENDHLETIHVTQDVDKNILIWAPFLEESYDEGFNQLMEQDRVLNVHTEITDPEVIAESTRLMTPWIPRTLKTGTEVIQGFTPMIASDIVVGAFYYSDPSGVSEPRQLRTLVRNSTNVDVLRDWIQKDLFAWCAFDWAPKLYYITNATASEPEKVEPIFEWDHYTVIGAKDNNSVLQRLNIACNLSMWSIPKWGTFKVQ